MKKTKVWLVFRKKWNWVNVGHHSADKDGYCLCFVCQEQKELEKKREKENSLPDELFEL